MLAPKTYLPIMLSAILIAPTSYAEDSTIQELTNRIKNLEAQVEATAVQVESNISSASASNTTIGGYGEMHYNNLTGSGGASDSKSLDFHRLITFIGHKFSKGVRFWSELEVEHSIAGDGKNGAIELEQAYIEVDLNQNHKTRFGVMLIPVGIMNETHEPPVFYGVERNPVEKNIIPTTWSGGGVSLLGELAPGVSYEVAVHEGLNTTASNSYLPRKGRQKTSNAEAKNLAYTGRIKYTGVAGLELAATLHNQSNITQGNDSTAGSATLIETHAIYNSGSFTVKALYAQWTLSGSGPKAIGADEQSGWYIEPSYKINEKFGVFARLNNYDNTAGSSAGASVKNQTDVGFNYWVHPNVVVKVDFQTQDNDDGKDQNGLNLGMGYMF
ncbi:MAG: porin [Woeseiaceae bacterium]